MDEEGLPDEEVQYFLPVFFSSLSVLQENVPSLLPLLSMINRVSLPVFCRR